MNGLSLQLVLAFVSLIALQLTGVAWLPKTQGFTALVPTIGTLSVFGLSYWLMARMIQSGAKLSILIPLIATIVPMATVAIGVLLYGENPSFSRLALLGIACALIGAAARL
jgi:multidrug transporter EmrE-like cation transporter